jgi:hypothetical protein
VIPNLFHVVEQAHDAFGPLTSPERCGKFTEYVVPLLAAIDPNFGHLRKMPGQTQFNGHAVDAALYKATGQAIDIIGASKKASPETPAQPSWGVEEEARYTDSATYWIAAVTLPGGDEESDTNPPSQPPQPLPSGCKFDGCGAPVVIESIGDLRLEMDEKHAETMRALARIEDAAKAPRQIEVTGNRLIGTLKGVLKGL